MGIERKINKFTDEEKLLVKKIDVFVNRLKNKEIVVTADIDGVDVETHDKARQWFNEVHQTGYEALQFTEAYIMVQWAKELGIKNYKEYIIGLFNGQEVMTNALPVSGSLQLHGFLNHENINIPRVSARPDYTRDFTLTWYKKWMPWVNEKDIYMDAGKEINPWFKVQTIKDLGAKYHLEDYPDDAEKIVANTPAAVILVPQVWNKDYYPTHERIIKVPDNGLPNVMAAFFAMVDIEVPN